MNREIKFRAWDKWASEMYPNVQNHINDKVFSFGAMINNKERFIIQQFIGLKDKNGKDIYEGDIDNRNMEVKYNPLHCCFGWYLNGMFKAELIGNAFSELGAICQSDYEIIGNIYEHPHLLKEKAIAQS